MFIIAVGTRYGTESVPRMQFLHLLADSGLVNIWVQQMNHLMARKRLPSSFTKTTLDNTGSICGQSSRWSVLARPEP